MRTRVILGARWKSGLMCLGFAPSLMLLSPELRVEQPVWWAAGFFALGGVIGLYQLIRPPRLTLYADGFEYSGRGRPWSVTWRSIETLILWENPAPRTSQTLIGWISRPEDRKAGALAHMSRALGVDGALPGLWSLSPPALLEVMQTYHAAATRFDRAPNP